MEPNRLLVRCAVHLFLIKDGKILVEKRKNRSYCNGQYDVIAGHIHGGCDMYDEIIKIAKNEVNIDIKREDLKPIQVMHQNDSPYEYINYFFITDKYSGELKNNDIDYCDGLEWVDFKYPINNMMAYINEAIKYYLEDSNNKFTFYGWK